MKRLIIILFIFCSLKSIGQVPQAPIVFATITQMQSYAGTYFQAIVTDTVRGGIFSKTLSTAYADNGVIFSCATLGYRWIRQTSPSSALNLKWWGAIGSGISSITQDTIAFREVLKYIKARNGGALYIPNSTGFYAFAGMQLKVPDNTEIYGDGIGKSIIRAVAPTTSQYPGGIFEFGTIGPDTINGLFQAALLPYTYNIHDANMGDSVLILDDASKGSELKVGEVVFYGGNKYYHSGKTTKPRYVGECNEIVSIHEDSVFFVYPIAINLTTDSLSPILLNLNNNNTYNVQMKDTNHTSKNISIHDMTLQQAQRDELADTALNTRLAGIWSPGNGYNCHFYNLGIDAYNGIGGNMWTHTEMNNISLSEERHFFDGGFCTFDISVHDNIYTFKNSDVSDFAASLLLCNDGLHHGFFYNNSFFGTRDAKNISLFSDSWDISFYNCNFYFPNYHTDNIAINMGDGSDNGIALHDIRINNLTFVTDSCGLFLRLAGDTVEDLSAVNRNIFISNINFVGSKINGMNQDYGLYARRMTGVHMNGIYLPAGRVYIDDMHDFTVNNLYAPTSTLTFMGDTSGMRFNGSVFAACDSSYVPSSLPNSVNNEVWNNNPYFGYIANLTTSTVDGDGTSSVTITLPTSTKWVMVGARSADARAAGIKGWNIATGTLTISTINNTNSGTGNLVYWIQYK